MFKKVTLFALVLSLASVSIASAQLPEGRPITLDDIRNVVETVVKFLLIISGVVATGFVVWGGIMYMTAGANQTKVEDAKKRIKSGLIGAAIIFGIGVILQTLVGVVTGDFFLGGSGSSRSGSSQGGKLSGELCSFDYECRSDFCGSPPPGRTRGTCR